MEESTPEPDSTDSEKENKINENGYILEDIL
jgi:hypothetical protein